ncbi:claudin-18 isoform X1 [Takifugu flavidus]|uniref:claudin-18 isoform X1 n=1 Tax=Takifugu flavidus TaxID=433684 RepID=UPI0025445832|nr:claudin-18 isoform X1 [Takifugu flavidus]
MAPSVLQNGGFLLAVVGTAALIAATGTSKWSVRDRPRDEEASLYRHKGLWQDCATTFSGFTQCGSLQGSSGAFWAVRALMIIGVLLSVLGAMMLLFSLVLGSLEDSTKARMCLTAGVAIIIAGVCGITGASIYASHILASLKTSTYGGGHEANAQGGTPTYTFGPASFVGLMGGNVLVMAGILKSMAFREIMKAENASHLQFVYKPQLYFRTDAGAEKPSGGNQFQNYV